MIGLDGVLYGLWRVTSSLLIHGLLFGTVVLAMILIVRRGLHTMPRRAVVWLWLPLLFLVFSPILPGIGISMPDMTPMETMQALTVPDHPDTTADPVSSTVSEDLLSEEIPIQTTDPEPTVTVGDSLSWQGIAGLVWFVGAMGVLGCHLYRHFRVAQLYRTADLVEGRGRTRIYTLSGIRTPFVSGVLRPRIFLPTAPAADGDTREMILLHEQMHVRRQDVLWRLLWEAALCVYWFQPLLWLSQDAFIADTEGACDEAVLAALDADRDCRAAYAQTLLLYAGPRKRGYPTAFGMTEMQSRVHAILYPVGIRRAGTIGLVLIVLMLSAVACMTPTALTEGENVTAEVRDNANTVSITVSPTSELFGFVDGYVESHPDVWGTTNVTFTLPLGWTAVGDLGGIRGTLYDETGTECGTYDIQAFSPIDSADIPPENVPPDDRKWQAIYSDLRLSSVQNVADDDYRPVVTRARSESAVAVMNQAIYEEGVPAAAWEHRYVPLVLAFDQDCSMRLQMRFREDTDTAVMESIAASVVFAKTE